MAILKNALGDLTGRFGEFIFKQVRGKTIIAKRPVKRRLSLSPKSVAVRENMASTVCFAKCVNSVDILKTLWKGASAPQLGYQTIVKLNYSLINGSLITTRNIIVPETFRPSPVEDIKFFQGNLEIKLYKDYSFAPEGTLCVIIGNIKKEKTVPRFNMEVLYQGNVLPGDSVLIPLPDYRRWKNTCDRCIVYTAVLFEDRNKQINWLKSAAKELALE